MLTTTETSFPQAEVLVKHPATGDQWDIAPLLTLIHQHGAPALVAQLLYDTSDYITAEQNGPADTAARLRQVLRANNDVARAFDEIRVFKAQA